MIGDNPEHDIAGGRAAGLRTMWVGGQDRCPAAVAGRPDGRGRGGCDRSSAGRGSGRTTPIACSIA
ncbi:HAD hydrolase-like protein [Streptomyces coeruleorubidus]|uniref:HAD hydrolase-like protein n=1 Tax=Streptomyces coeruleorubidus TaxID=116188 RepID=UPI0037BC3752